MGPYYEKLFKNFQYPEKGGGGPLLWKVFSEIQFFQESTKPFIHLFLMKAGRFTYLKKHMFASNTSKCKIYPNK